jgi:pimeloyl-ACP methyl ester carboxylesterase
MRHVPLRASVQRQNHGLWFPPFDGSRWTFLAENTDAVPLRVIARRAALAQQIDVRSQLEQISQPTLIIQTEGEGRIAAACQAELKSRLPYAEDFWIDSTGQLPFLTHPHRLAKLLKPFFRGEPLPEADGAPAVVADVAATPFANTMESHDD